MVKDLDTQKSKKQIFIENFIGGTGWGLGTAVGAVIVVALLGFLAAKARAIPFIGQVIYDIMQAVQHAGK